MAETLNLSRLPGYRTGGTLHLIANNQLGFTTGPAEDRSTLYASDLAKGFEIPIVHVNADDPIACLAAVRLAVAYRAEFGKDFLIDLIGYRRWGHNEGDEPSFTQPRDVRGHRRAADRARAVRRGPGRARRGAPGRARSACSRPASTSSSASARASWRAARRCRAGART